MPNSSPCRTHAEVRTIPFAPVKLPLRSRFVAWLCLALLLLIGSTPAQGFVVCIEADGCVSVEVKASAADCGSCDGHDRDGPAEDAVSGPSTNPGCPCIDYVVPGFPDQRVVTNRSLELQVGPWIAPPADLHVVQPVPATTSERGPPPRAPRVSQTLAHIRSVILLV